jgi:hypothetical protein
MPRLIKFKKTIFRILANTFYFALGVGYVVVCFLSTILVWAVLISLVIIAVRFILKYL